MYENNRQKDFFWGAFVGGTLATLSALLFTTKKGKQIQRQIANTYEDLEDSVKDTFHESKEQLEEVAEHAGKRPTHKTKHEEHETHSK